MSSCVSPLLTIRRAGKHLKSASWWAALSHLCCLSCVWSWSYEAPPTLPAVKKKQKWRCPTTIAGIHGRCNHTRPVQSGHTRATGPLPRPLHMGTDEDQAKEEPKYFPCPWDHLCHQFLHRWEHHPHSPGTASQESRQVICLPTYRQTQRSRRTEDCPGGPSRHWEEWAPWKAQGKVLPAWSLTPPPVAPANLRDIPLPGWNYPAAHQQVHVPPQVVDVPPASQHLASLLQQECSSSPSRPSQNNSRQTNSRLEKIGSTWCFGTHGTTSYAKYSQKSELEPSGQLLKRCKKQKPASRSKRSLKPPRPEELA